MMFLKIAELSNVIHSNEDLFMILYLQLFLLMKNYISQLLIGLWNLKLNSMFWLKKKSKMLEGKFSYLIKKLKKQ